MRRRKVVYSETAHRDLIAILHWIAGQASPLSAISIVQDLEDYIDALDIASERGIDRTDLRPGLRVIPHKRAMIAVEVSDTTVTILHVFYGGQNWEAALSDD